MNEEAMEKQADSDFHLLLHNNSCKNATSNQSEARSISVEIPVAVFTAHRGYDWSKLPDFVSRDEADSLFEKVMSVKTTHCDGLLLYGDSFEGVLYEGKYAFVFRLMTAEKWDQAKRDSKYCACAFIPYDMLKDVDFERLLDMVFFRTTTHTPDSLLNYYDEDFHCPTTDELSSTVCNFKIGDIRDFDWRLVGPILFNFGYKNSKWFFAQISSRGESKFIAEFGNWDKEKCIESSPEVIEHGEQTREEAEQDNFQMNVVAVSTETEIPPELPPVHDNEIHQSIEELPKENRLYSSSSGNGAEPEDVAEEETAAELAKVNGELENLTIKYNKIHSDLARVRQERDAARAKYKQYYQAYIDLLKSSAQKDPSINWPLLAGAFSLGAILPVVIFLAIQLLTSHGGNDVSPNGVSHSVVQSGEALQ